METVLLALAALLLGLLLLSHWFTFLQLTRQQGRLLLRLERLEQGLAEVLSLAGRNGGSGGSTGLPVETPFPPFELPDLDGNRVSLAQFQGRRVLLIHWNPACGFCNLIAPDLAGLQADLEARQVALVFVSREDVAANRQFADAHGLRYPVLLQDATTAVEAFRNQGTPVAYLLDEEGRVAAPFAEGADEVLALAHHTAANEKVRMQLPGERPLSESRIERNGLKAGTPAPLFRLPDLLTGREVSLEDYRGRWVLLLFTDPHCGPCDQLAPHLNQIHEGNPDLALIVVGRGDPDENRRKAEEHHARYPLVLQSRWELSRQYGIFATPVAFLIDQDGILARDVAQGEPEILALAAAATRRQAEAVPG